jgi:hypothetical protein
MSPRLRRDRKRLPDWIMVLHLFGLFSGGPAMKL